MARWWAELRWKPEALRTLLKIRFESLSIMGFIIGLLTVFMVLDCVVLVLLVLMQLPKKEAGRRPGLRRRGHRRAVWRGFGQCPDQNHQIRRDDLLRDGVCCSPSCKPAHYGRTTRPRSSKSSNSRLAAPGLRHRSCNAPVLPRPEHSRSPLQQLAD